MIISAHIQSFVTKLEDWMDVVQGFEDPIAQMQSMEGVKNCAEMA